MFYKGLNQKKISFLSFIIASMFFSNACVQQSKTSSSSASGNVSQNGSDGQLRLEGSPVSEITASLYFTYNNYAVSADTGNFEIVEVLPDHEEFHMVNFTMSKFPTYSQSMLSELKTNPIKTVQITKEGFVVESENKAKIASAKICYKFVLDISKNSLFLSEKNFDSFVTSHSEISIASAGNICLDSASKIISVDNNNSLVKDFGYDAKDNFFSYLSNNGFDPNPLVVFVTDATNLKLAGSRIGGIVGILDGAPPARGYLRGPRRLPEPGATRPFFPEQRSPRPELTANDYRIGGQLGSGSEGIVYDLIPRVGGVVKAVKIPKDMSPGGLAKATEEMQKHTGILDAVDDAIRRAGKSGQARDYIIPVERIPGAPSHALVMPKSVSGEKVVFGKEYTLASGKKVVITFDDYARQAAEAVEALKSAGFSHNDIKPPNFLLDLEDGRIKLADFGISAPAGRLEGGYTPGYVPPGTPFDRDGFVAAPIPLRDEYALGRSLQHMYEMGPPRRSLFSCATPTCDVTKQLLGARDRIPVSQAVNSLSAKAPTIVQRPVPPPVIRPPQRVYVPAERVVIGQLDLQEVRFGGQQYSRTYRTSYGREFMFDVQGKVYQKDFDGVFRQRLDNILI